MRFTKQVIGGEYSIYFEESGADKNTVTVSFNDITFQKYECEDSESARQTFTTIRETFNDLASLFRIVS